MKAKLMGILHAILLIKSSITISLRKKNVFRVLYIDTLGDFQV
jgi:hypothetical protein